jgi:hypothetical protein
MRAQGNMEMMLIEDMGKFAKDPYGWVMYAFQWGKGELEKYEGPDMWQADVLQKIGRQLQQGIISSLNDVIRIAVASGNGPGKTCLVSWIILWAMSTFEDTRGVVTANTENQLRTKTWSELAKWNRLSICKHWFKVTATAIYSTNPEHERTWRIDQIPWSDSKPEAFAGLHNQGKRVILLFDEASAIPDIIWETAEGAMTDEETEIIWGVFGNPTRNDGYFHKCFHKNRHRWYTKHIDTRKCKYTNKRQIAQWLEDYGEDSDFFRVHVRGRFPHTSSRQFISTSLVEAAQNRHLRPEQYNFAPVIIGVDPAWTGDDSIEIFLRQGLMSKHLASYEKNDDDGIIAGYVARFEDEYNADAVFIDLGWGTGIYSMGKQMGRQWQLVAFGGGATQADLLNKRIDMWSSLKTWLKEGGSIPDDEVLYDDLITPEFRMVESGTNYGKMRLETKQEMKARQVPSPNRADALALTFAFPVKSKKQKFFTEQKRRIPSRYDPLKGSYQQDVQQEILYDPLSPIVRQSFN